MSLCYFCHKELGDTRVAIGKSKEIHTECYEPYVLYLKQICKALQKKPERKEDMQ